MSGGRSGKMVNYINYRMRVTLSDTRMLVGKFLAFDKHMNLVLSDWLRPHWWVRDKSCESARTDVRKTYMLAVEATKPAPRATVRRPPRPAAPAARPCLP